jgi:hypothetical protein
MPRKTKSSSDVPFWSTKGASVSSNGSDRKIKVDPLDELEEAMQQVEEARDWDEKTTPDIHVHLPQPSQPDSDPPPSKPKHKAGQLVMALATLLGAIAAILKALGLY